MEGRRPFGIRRRPGPELNTKERRRTNMDSHASQNGSTTTYKTSDEVFGEM
jgi:hypothetical protein